MHPALPYSVSCPAARDQLLHHYFLELVEPIARAQHRQLPPSVELGDLEQAGYLGLHDALQRFDNRVCDDFRPYAKQRIRGSIHDWLRREDLLSRGARADVRKVQTTADQFRTRYGFEPEEEVLKRTRCAEIRPCLWQQYCGPINFCRV